MKRVFIFLFIVFSALTFAQVKPSLEQLKKLGRDSLIKLAIKKIDDKNFNALNYDRVVVKADSSNLIVIFDLAVVLKSKSTCYYDAITVSLFGNYGGRSIQGNCDNPEYYNPSKKHSEKIKFVFDCINKENEIGDIPDCKLSSDELMNITEYPTYYFVEMSSSSTYSHYKIKKNSGVIYDAGHKHYAHDPSAEENHWIIIQ